MIDNIRDQQVIDFINKPSENSYDTSLVEKIAWAYFPRFKTCADDSTQDYLKSAVPGVISQLNLLPDGWSLNGSDDSGLDVESIRSDFPILSEKVNGKNLVWLDNAATSQKPKCVIDRLIYFYEHENSNVHRGAHTLAARATDAYEKARGKISRFLNAESASEIVFVRGATEAINLVAQTYGKTNISAGDEILISCLEHHANIVPWQMLCAEKGAVLRIIPVDESGQIDLNEYHNLLNPKVKIVSLAHVSNVLGTIVPIEQMIRSAHQIGAMVLIDGAQAVSHIKVDVKALDADFYVFSGHKIYGPTGIGVLYGKLNILNEMTPYHGGGNMIRDVTFEKSQYQSAPHRFEAGTGNIADAVALGEAIDYISRIGMDAVTAHEHSLLEYGTKALLKVPGLKIIGNAKEKTSILSFAIDGFSDEYIGQALNQQGIAVRAGHHCSQPVLRRYGLESSVRASLAVYNTKTEIEKTAETLFNLQR